MSKMLRLSDDEVEALRIKAIEINKILIHKGMQPLKDSEIAHAVLKESIKKAFVMSDGKIRISGE